LTALSYPSKVIEYFSPSNDLAYLLLALDGDGAAFKRCCRKRGGGGFGTDKIKYFPTPGKML